jgi:hypothetical protein
VMRATASVAVATACLAAWALGEALARRDETLLMLAVAGLALGLATTHRLRAELDEDAP